MKNVFKRMTWNVLYGLRSILDPLVRFREVSVICYHSVSDSKHDTTVTASEFEKQLEYLKNKGYAFVSLEQMVTWREGKGEIPRKSVVLTFDDGYQDFKTTVCPLLAKYQAPATVFIIGDPFSTGWRLDEEPQFLSGAEIQELHANPLVEVGYHSHSHPDLKKLSPIAISQQVRPPQLMQFFAYPGGNHSPEAVVAVQGAGYRAAFTIHPSLTSVHNNSFLLPRVVILHSMTPRDVAMRASKAVDWYDALRS